MVISLVLKFKSKVIFWLGAKLASNFKFIIKLDDKYKLVRVSLVFNLGVKFAFDIKLKLVIKLDVKRVTKLVNSEIILKDIANTKLILINFIQLTCQSNERVYCYTTLHQFQTNDTQS